MTITLNRPLQNLFGNLNFFVVRVDHVQALYRG
jgi:hypothetical protein